MKFLLIKALLFSRKKDQGFTLPIVIGIGFVMVLLSTVSLVQSGEENLTALSQQGSSDSLAMAEIGAARYRNVLNNNRALAVNDLILTDASGNPVLDASSNPINNWETFDTQTCDVISATGNGLSDNGATAWKDVIVGGNTIGSYRLVNYEYDQNPNDGNLADDNNFDQIDDANNDFNDDGNLDGNSDARGFLTVQGKDTAGTSTINANISQIQVEIPLGVNTSDLDDLDPALWIGQSSVTNLGNDIELNGANIVYQEPSVAGASGCTITGVDAVTGENTIGDARDLPPIADLSSVTPRNLGANFSNASAAGINNFNGGEIILGTALDDAGTGTAAFDATEGRYYYNVPGDLDISNGEAIISDGTSEVILFIAGDLDIDTGGGTVRLINSSHTSETGATTPPDIDRYLEIHVTGDVDISGSGTLNITGLLRVDGTVNISESVDVNVTGAIWANDWDNTTSGKIDIATDDYRFYSITANRTPAPLTYRPFGWETQEAN